MQRESVRPPLVQADAVPAEGSQGPQSTGDFFVGKLLSHGLAPYRWNPRKREHYFMRIDTDEGPHTIWSRDLPRALEQARSEPKIGDQVVLRRVPSERLPVKVRGPVAGDAKPDEADLPSRRRQGWIIEKRDFLETRGRVAEILRDRAIGPREGVKQHPELAGAYLSLRAAEIAARQLKHPDDQKKFVEAVREKLADLIALGAPFPTVRLRVRRDEGELDLDRACPRAR